MNEPIVTDESIGWRARAADYLSLERNVTILSQAADFRDQLDDHPAARGLQLISHGFPLVTKDDHETAQRAAFVYDSLYASIENSLPRRREVS